MKKIFTLVLSSLFSLSLLAFDGSRLSISASGNASELKVEIDGQLFTMKNNTIELGYLAQGRHAVKIYKEGNKNNYGFGRRKIIYESTISLKRGFHTDIAITRFGKVMVDEQKIDVNSEWYNDEDEYYDSDGGYSNTYNGMSGREFEQLKESLRKEWFENNRLTSAKVVIDKSCFTASQVKDLMLLFTFETNRMELAKFAYRKLVDKQNAYLMMDALTFNSSKDELARFIRESR